MMPTASKVELASRCPGALALPQTRIATPESDAGDERHAESEAAVNAGAIPAWLEDAWPGFTWRAEVKFAIDIVSGRGRELGVGSDRDYSMCSLTEVPGTADLVGRGPDRQLVIPDLKSFDPSVPHPRKNKQLATLALAATRAYGLDECEVAIKHEVRGLERAHLDVFDLDAFMSELRAVCASVQREQESLAHGGTPTTVTGKQCRWCDAFDACPKQRELAAMVRDGAAEYQLEAAIPCNSDEAAAELYDFTKRLGLLLKRANAAIHARAAERPIPLRNGMMLGKVTKLGNEQLDGNVAYEVVRTRYGQPIADAAVTREASKTKIREALGFAVAKGAVAEAEREVLKEIRTRGGATRKQKESIEEYPAHELKAGAAGVLKAANE